MKIISVTDNYRLGEDNHQVPRKTQQSPSYPT